MALYAVGWFVYKALVELSNHRLLGIVHFFQVMAAAAVLEVVAGHCVDNAFFGNFTSFNPFFRSGVVALDFADERNEPASAFAKRS